MDDISYLSVVIVRKRIMLAKLVTLTLLHSISATTVECPDNSPNWFVSGDSCYLVSLEPLSWFASQEVKYCIYNFQMFPI